MKMLLSCLILVSLVGCVRSNPVQVQNGNDAGLERRIEYFSAPDKYGVVCYQDRARADNLACVKVTNE